MIILDPLGNIFEIYANLTSVASFVFCNKGMSKTEKIDKNMKLKKKIFISSEQHDEFGRRFWEKCHKKIHKKRVLHLRKYLFEETIGQSNFNFKCLAY